MDGLTAARNEGLLGVGKSRPTKPGLNDKQKREIRALLGDPHAQVPDVAKYGVSRTTLYKHVGVVQPRAA